MVAVVVVVVKKILAVINATYAVAKRKPEKIRLAGIIIIMIILCIPRELSLFFNSKAF